MRSLILYPTKEGNKFTEQVKEIFFDESKYTLLVIDYTRVKGTKWELAKKLLFPELVKEYDFVWLIDDDLYLKDFNPNEFINLMIKHNLDVAQPALTDNSYFSHRVTLKDGDGVRRTDFVEIMMPVYTKDAWLKLYDFIDVYINKDGWGYDFIQFPRMGIIDKYPVVHTRPCGNSYSTSLAMDNMIIWCAKYNIGRPAMRTIEVLE